MRATRWLPLLALLLAAPAAAQQQVAVRATVPTSSPSGAGVTNPMFGSVTPIPGQVVVVEVPATATGAVRAGEFAFDVSGNSGVVFTMQLPATLGDGLGRTLAVAFNDARFGGHCVQSATVTCAQTPFDPTLATVRVCRQALGNGSCNANRVWPAGSQLRVFVGGRISVPDTQRAATYTGSITMTIVQAL